MNRRVVLRNAVDFLSHLRVPIDTIIGYFFFFFVAAVWKHLGFFSWFIRLRWTWITAIPACWGVPVLLNAKYYMDFSKDDRAIRSVLLVLFTGLVPASLFLWALRIEEWIQLQWTFVFIPMYCFFIIMVIY
jgi:hypothetical protein